MRTSLRLVLEGEGFTDIHTAASGEECFHCLGLDGEAPVASIDVILMDNRMPGLDGVSACRRIKRAPRTAHIPILLITGYNEDEVLTAAFEAGAADFITKPIKVVELLARLRSALALKQELDGRRQREQDLRCVTRQLHEANRMLKRLSDQDALTGLDNRRSFDSHLAHEWNRGAREQVPLSLIMMDIDHFKAFNDHYGHPSGDECLRQVARSLATPLHRPGDLLARYGGEEFIILLPWTGLLGARALAERLRERVADLAIPHEHSPVAPHVTLSLGVACAVPKRQASPEGLVKAADEALYRAKEHGRNRVEVFTHLLTPEAEDREGPIPRERRC
jgi:diguanylate cyclase (GGDEF)-like protein